MLILRDLLTGTKRFSELKRSLSPITQKMLTQQLREMESDGVVKRKVYPESPSKSGVFLDGTRAIIVPGDRSDEEVGRSFKRTKMTHGLRHFS